ncbi:MAG: ferritin-like domain-containing protein [Alphaproteobacteria bacterium]
MTKTLCELALDVLNCGDAVKKAEASRISADKWKASSSLAVGLVPDMPDRPARPDRPEMLHATKMPRRRKAGSDKSKIALLHAIAHIELNAIDLAWDIIARFTRYSDENAKDGFTLPRAFYDDWVKVADDEAKHFLMIQDRLSDFGAAYGDLPAHDGLWESSTATAHDLPARLAIVPMVLEARGLDVTPNMISMMKAQGDDKTADMLQIIHDDEITHVRAGTVWFESWCGYHGHDIEEYWQSLVKTYFDGRLKPPFNHPSREEAGMIRDWYEALVDIEYTQTAPREI